MYSLLLQFLSTWIFNSPALQHYLKAIFYNIFPEKGLTGVKYSPFVFLHDVYCYKKDIADTDGVYVADMLMDNQETKANPYTNNV